MKNFSFSTFADSLTGNRGAVSMLISAIDNLSTKSKDLQINIYSVYPKTDKKICLDSNIKVFNGTPLNLIFIIIPICIIKKILSNYLISIPKVFIPKSLDDLFQTKIILIIGGTTFTDSQLFKIPYNVACILPSIILNKKSIMYSQTLGPFNNSFNKILAKIILKRVTLVIARGKYSYTNLKEIGLKNITYCTDSAFSMIIPDKVRERIKNKYIFLSNQKLVGISTNSIVEKKCKRYSIDHNQIWIKFIKYLLKKGYTILLIPHSIKSGSNKKHNNDLPTLKKIYESLPIRENVYLIDEDYNPKELRIVVSLCDMYIASRFHSMISCLAEAVPVLVTGWGYHKYIEVLEEFDLQDYYLSFKDLNLNSLIKGFDNLVLNNELIRSKINRNLKRVIISSKKNHDLSWQIYQNKRKKINH